jgi:hypothetical protein
MAEKQKYVCDSVGNIVGIEIPEYNKITEEDDIQVAKAKKKKQIEQWEAVQPRE